MKVIRSGEKGFKEEKARMYENPEEVNKMPLTKKEQLRKVFSYLFASMLAEYCTLAVDEDKLTEKYTNIFLKEVTIRVKL